MHKLILSGMGLAMMAIPMLCGANDLESEAFHQQLEQHIQVINQTKQVLDDPNARPTHEQQTLALCQRIQAYRGIVDLAQINPQQETATMMSFVAQAFLQRQQASFTQSGLSENAFCELPMKK